jgi:hypothetical protein
MFMHDANNAAAAIVIDWLSLCNRPVNSIRFDQEAFSSLKKSQKFLKFLDISFLYKLRSYSKNQFLKGGEAFQIPL